MLTDQVSLQNCANAVVPGLPDKADLGQITKNDSDALELQSINLDSKQVVRLLSYVESGYPCQSI